MESLSGALAGIDVHKRMLAVVVAEVDHAPGTWERQKFGTTISELKRLVDWLTAKGVTEAAMESTAQYWKPVWLALEGRFRLHLAQARSTTGAAGRKSDFADAVRIVKRLQSGDLTLSYVPDPEQRRWRLLTRAKYQLIRDRVRLQSQIEGLLEEGQITLSSFISDLLGASGLRILQALANGENDPQKLALLGSDRLRASSAELQQALSGQLHPVHRQVLQLQLQRLHLLEKQIAALEAAIAKTLRAHQEALARLCELPGLGVDSAHQIVAEVGPTAMAFPSAAHLASWVGVCPGREESAGQSRSNRSPKGNRPMRRLLNQLAWAAVKAKGSHFEAVFRRLVPRLGVKKAIWAIAHRLLRLIWKVLHDGVQYVEFGPLALKPQAIQQRKRRLIRDLRKLGYDVQLTPLTRAVRV